MSGAKRSPNLSNFFSGVIIGGLVGAAIGLLLAPQSGDEVRSLIREKGIELKDRAVEYSQDVLIRNRVQDKKDDIYEKERQRSVHDSGGHGPDIGP